MSWDAELQRKSRKFLEGLDKYVAYHHFKFFENVQFGISISQHHIPGTASGNGSHKECEDLCCAELVNYILNQLKENVLTASSAAKEVTARVDLLQATQFTASSRRNVSTKTIQNCFALVVLNTHTWRCSVKSIVKMTSCWKCSSEITKIFHSSTAVFSVVMKMKIVRKRLLSELQRNTIRSETGKDDTTEQDGVRVQILVPIC
jgi:hypothetical protein